ncbi:MAG: response regulator transcription factor [Anaerolineales bacterium]|nr:response regulator transcription factor [Anaerolineales bacterium]
METGSARPPIKVALIDDHHLILESVRHKLAGNPEFDLVATGTAGEMIEPIIEQHRPDVVLLDLGIPAKAGTTIRDGGRYQVLPAIRRMRQKFPETQFLILSSDVDSSLVEGALEVEAMGYLLKDDELSVDLLQAIRAVNNGAVYFSKEIQRRYMARRTERQAKVLTERQLEVLLAIWQKPELTYAEHAKILQISENTFDNHMKAVFRELRVKNLAAAMIRAFQAGLIPLHIQNSPGTADEQSSSSSGKRDVQE